MRLSGGGQSEVGTTINVHAIRGGEEYHQSAVGQDGALEPLSVFNFGFGNDDGSVGCEGADVDDGGGEGERNDESQRAEFAGGEHGCSERQRDA